MAPAKHDMAVWRWLIRLFAKHRKEFAGLLLSLVLLGASEALLPWLLGGLIDGSQDPEAFVIPVAWLPAIVLALMLLRAVLMFVSSYLSKWLCTTIEYDLRCQVAELVLRWPALQLRKMTGGEAVYRMLDVPGQLCGKVTALSSSILQNVVKVVGYAVLLFYLDWFLTSFVALVVPVVAVVWIKTNKRIASKTGRLIEVSTHGAKYVGELLRMWPIVRIFGGEDVEKGKQRSAFDDIRRLQLRCQVLSSISHVSAFVLLAFPVALLMHYYKNELGTGNISPGEVTAYISAMLLLQVAVRDLAKKVNEMPQIYAFAKAFTELKDAPLEQDTAQQHTQLPQKGGIEFSQVSFTYPGREEPAISQASIRIEEGETIALVGPSGAGKSTVVSLLMRMFDPDDGKITIFGKDTQDWPLAGLRKRFSVVTQTPLLFNDTIAANIAYPKEPDNDRATEIMTELGMDSFMQQLPKGLATTVNNDNVSGGQQQMLTIARAMYHDSPIIIFDEATSSLDSASEKTIREGAKKLFAGRTAIIIAHRFTNIELADRVIVMERGRILDHGTTKELLQRCELFNTLWQAQKLEH